jgi:hypothetical protein
MIFTKIFQNKIYKIVKINFSLWGSEFRKNLVKNKTIKIKYILKVFNSFKFKQLI